MKKVIPDSWSYPKPNLKAKSGIQVLNQPKLKPKKAKTKSENFLPNIKTRTKDGLKPDPTPKSKSKPAQSSNSKSKPRLKVRFWKSKPRLTRNPSRLTRNANHGLSEIQVWLNVPLRKASHGSIKSTVGSLEIWVTTNLKLEPSLLVT